MTSASKVAILVLVGCVPPRPAPYYGGGGSTVASEPVPAESSGEGQASEDPVEDQGAPPAEPSAVAEDSDANADAPSNVEVRPSDAIDTERAHKRPRRQPASLEAAATACNDLVYPSADRDRCIRDVTNARFDGVAAVAACKDAVYPAEDRLACVASAMQVRRDPTAEIRACVDLVYPAEQRLACVAALRTSKKMTAGGIAACKDAVYPAEDRLTCVREAGMGRRDPIELIQFCVKQKYAAEDRLQCIRDFR